MGIEQLSTVWSEWHVVEQIGEGSFGKVYKAVKEDHGITNTAAIKVISIPKNRSEHESLIASGFDETSSRTYYDGIVTDFKKEIKMMVDMKSATNVVSIEDYKVIEKTEEIGWDIFIRMELLESFDKYTAVKNITEDEVIKFGQDICSALELFSSKGIIHRDIKPQNIFVTPDKRYKVGDFGIARELEKSGSFMQMTSIGAPSYVAPEVILTGEYDETADIYSLGLVLYKLLNKNRLPFINPEKPKESVNASSRRLKGDQFPMPVQASPAMSHVIIKACQHNPKMRFNTATDFKNALEAVKNGTYNIHLLSDETPDGYGTQQLLDPYRPKPVKEDTTSTVGIDSETKTDIPVEPLKPKKKFSKYRKVAITSGAAFICWLILGIIILIMNGRIENTQPQAGVIPNTSEVISGSEKSESSNGNQSDGNDSQPPELTPTPDNEDETNIIDDDLNNVSITQYGNIPGNIVNGGLVAIQGDWIYYSWNGLHCININGGEKIKISNDAAFNISVLNDRIYYVASDYVSNTTTFTNTIISIRVDGSDRQRLNDDFSMYVNVVDDKIYYSSYYSDGNIYSIDIDGTNQRKLNNDNSWYVNVVDNRIYYSNHDDGQKIYSMNTDGNDKKKLNDDSSAYINVVGGMVYYSNHDDGGSIYSMKIDGSDRQKLNNDSSRYIIVVDNRIYYVWYMEGIYSMKVDGTDKHRLSDDKMDDLDGYLSLAGIVDDYVFISESVYRSHSDLFKIRKDGSNRQIIEH